MSIVEFLLANWLNSTAAWSRSTLTAFRRSSRNSRSRRADPVEALAAYEALRRPATAEIVLSNRQLGPEEVMKMAHERAPGGFGHVEDVISRAELEEVSRRYRSVTWARREPAAP